MEQTKNSCYFSVVIPVYNESKNIELCFNEVSSVLESTKKSFEVVFVNDGSKDNSLEILQGLAKQHNTLKVVNLSRNFGQEAALIAGLKYASGELIFTMDCDLQDPPSVMLDLFKKQQEGYDVVYAVRKKREGETFLKKLTAKVYYKLFRKVANLNMPKNSNIFRIFTNQVKAEILKLTEKHKFLRATNAWVGFKQTGVEFVRHERKFGKTNYNYSKLTKLAVNSIVSYSAFPLQLMFAMSLFGLGVSALGLITLVVLAILSISFTWLLWLILAISISTFTITLCLSVVAMYVYRTFEETQNRPDYIVKETINIE